MTMCGLKCFFNEVTARTSRHFWIDGINSIVYIMWELLECSWSAFYYFVFRSKKYFGLHRFVDGRTSIIERLLIQTNLIV